MVCGNLTKPVLAVKRNQGVDMNLRSTHEAKPTFMKAGIVGFAAPVLVWAGLGLANLLGAPSAQADPLCPKLQACTRWCPGDAYPAGRPIPWDAGVCHDYYWDSYGVHDIGTGQFYSWRSIPWH